MKTLTIEHEAVGGSYVPSRDYGAGRECQCNGSCTDVASLGLGCLTGPGGRMGRCARTMSRFSPPQKFGDVFFEICGPCLDRHIDLQTDLEKLANSGRGKRGRPGRYLYGLKDALDEQGLSQAGFARELGVNVRSFVKVVQLKQRCGPEREKLIATALGVSVDVLR
jgi:hypothetical protein